MAEEYLEIQFRVGATHGASWFWRVAKHMTKQGKTPEAISDRSGDLVQVLQDWRQGNVSLPSEGNPWEWKAEDLDAFIAKRQHKW
jgi:hypothetical protein